MSLEIHSAEPYLPGRPGRKRKDVTVARDGHDGVKSVGGLNNEFRVLVRSSISVGAPSLIEVDRAIMLLEAVGKLVRPIILGYEIEVVDIRGLHGRDE